jgi:hypothetical protein
MPKRLSERPLGQQLVVFLTLKIGMKQAIKVATFMVQWGIVARRKGREPSIAEYMVYWSCSEATYYRELRIFHKVWPEEKNPQRKWQWIEKNCRLPMKIDPEQGAARLLAGPVPA